MRVIFTIFMLCIALLAKTQLPSPIPPAKEFWINLNPAKCDESCLKKLLNDDMLASFIAIYEEQDISNPELKRAYWTIRLGASQNGAQIAVLLADSLKSYSKAIATAIEAYIASHDESLSAHFIRCKNEGELTSALNEARSKGASIFIVPTKELGLNLIASELKSGEIAYIPTLSQTHVKSEGHIIFGGIEYQAQIALLSRFIDSKVAIFSDESELASKLEDMIRQNGINIASKTIINSSENGAQMLEKRANALNGANIFLNLPLIKSAFAINYLPKFEIKPARLLSTQVGFNPQIFSLISPLARGEMLVTSSLDRLSDELLSAGALLGINSWHNWVSYSAVLGFERLSERYVEVLDKRDFSEEIAGAKVLYKPKVYRLSNADFIEVW